jgi:predicted phage terminase large subunit-like protein
MYFKRSETKIVDTIPDDVIKIVRRWDLAATEPSESVPNPDWTSGTKMALRRNGRYIILDNIHVQKRAADVRELVKNTASMDGFGVKIGLSQDPGQAGKDQVGNYVADLAGFTTEVIRESGSKITRAEPYSSQWQAGNIDLLRGAWNEEFLVEHELFGDMKGKDDQVDSASGAFLMLTGSNLSVWEKLGRG